MGLAATHEAVVAANPHGDQRSPALQHLLDCRGIADPTQRLACYDEQAKAFDIATAKKDVIVLDRQQIAETKRGLFGFQLPKIALFEPRDDRDAKEKPEPDESRLETTIRSLHRGANGLWTIVLDGGAVWEQVESGREANEPRAGMAISIRRAAMGTYFATIGNGIRMRIRRIN